MRVEEYIQENGSNPFKKWFDKLKPQVASKVTVALLRLELGNTSSIKWFGSIGEYRIDWGPGYRIYLTKGSNNLILLLGGGIKSSQQADIKRAKIVLKEYKNRKANALKREANNVNKQRL